MIRYALCCDDGHRFDSWFYDSAAFDEQVGREQVRCPRCDSPRVSKTIMAPAIVAARREIAPETTTKSPLPIEVSDAGSLDVTLVDDERRKLVRAFREKILAETRDVGLAFAKEARRIHEDEAGEKIRGQATLQETRDLLEDGILVLPMPPLPDDLN